ncbi:MAG: CRISPR-associated protein Csx11 [Deltaproteobacteria bacterium]|nr:CRISPR-associated protein Csx11 [Deltaproteobacteria bacterium]
MSLGKLEVLKQNRTGLLLAEVAGLLHDVGKFCNLHIEAHSTGGVRKWSNDHAYKVVVDDPRSFIQLSKAAANLRKPAALNNLLNATSPTAADFLPSDAKDALTRNTVSFLDKTYSLAELIMLGTPGFATDKKRSQLLDGKDGWLPAVLGVCHNEAHHDKQEPAKGEGTQMWPDAFISTAFGYESLKVIVNPSSPENLDERLKRLPYTNLISSRYKFLIEFAFGLGDTRRPINEVTLSDWGAGVAALFKSALASCILENVKREIRQWVCWREKLIDHDLRWRMLRVNFDVLGLYSKAIKIADLLGYRRALDKSCAAIKKLVEEEYPLGNQVYRDTTGIYFTFPDIDLPTELGDEIRRLVEQIEPELAPRIEVQDPKGKNASEQLKCLLSDARREALKALEQPFDRQNLSSYWQSLWSNLKSGKWEVCPVCRLRPMKEHDETCAKCVKRRDSRVKAWLKSPAETIWMDEIADHNGRVALLVGKFGLDDWLSGDLVQTMLVKAIKSEPAKCVPKNPSPARLRRVWETCQRFWYDTVESSILLKHTYGTESKNAALRRIRLTIEPREKDSWEKNILFDGTLNGRPISLVWDHSQQHFVTAINLQLTIDENGSLEHLQQAWPGRVVEGPDPVDPRKHRHFTIQKVDQAQGSFSSYLPSLTLLTSPDQFLAFVPANEALEVAEKIKDEYEKQMGKVQNRLPLFLGLVFFQRKLPLMAVIDTARQMIGQVLLGEEKWWIECDAKTDDKVCLRISLGDKRIDMTFPVKMGDGSTDDLWYPYFFVENFADGTPNNRNYCFQHNGRWLVHVINLQKDDQVAIIPSRFAYIFLENTAERFRFDPEQHTMLLGELPHLREMWHAICNSPDMSVTKIQAIHALFEAKRQKWKLGKPTPDNPIIDETFRHLVETTLKRDKIQGVTVEDVLNSRFRRCVDLHLHILKRRVYDEKKRGGTP